jgi:hypothetical protein
MVVWLSAIHILYLFCLPTLANISIAPLVQNQLASGFWLLFGIIGIPIGFAGMMVFNPFPNDIGGAIIRTFLLPVMAGLWWWIEEGTLLAYFPMMLVFEFMAIYLSLLIMSFIPLRYYDPHNPSAGSSKTYFTILLTQGILAAGGLTAILIIAIWPWVTIEPYWHHPVTHLLILFAAIQYLVSNFRLQYKNSTNRWQGGRKIPRSFPDTDISIEAILLLAPLPWLASFWFLLDS